MPIRSARHYATHTGNVNPGPDYCCIRMGAVKANSTGRRNTLIQEVFHGSSVEVDTTVDEVRSDALARCTIAAGGSTQYHRKRTTSEGLSRDVPK